MTLLPFAQAKLFSRNHLHLLNAQEVSQNAVVSNFSNDFIAPQKVMWQAWDLYQRTGRGKTVKIEFWTGMPTMFSVPKYSEVLNALRIQREIDANFGHNLVSIDSANRKATFKKTDGTEVTTDYMLLHVTPPQGPADYIKKSPLADSVGWVDVDQGTLQHKKCIFFFFIKFLYN
jgi:eukaryotic sulfide quinone oxidoreductase